MCLPWNHPPPTTGPSKLFKPSIYTLFNTLLFIYSLVGAFKEDDADRYPVEIRCAEFSEDESNLSLVASLSHSNQATEDFIAKYKDPQLKSMGSSLKLLLVAEGEAHIYPRLAPTCGFIKIPFSFSISFFLSSFFVIVEWDTCASQAIVEAAGGEVLQHEGNEVCFPLFLILYPFILSFILGSGGMRTRRTGEVQQEKPAQPVLHRLRQA